MKFSPRLLAFASLVVCAFFSTAFCSSDSLLRRVPQKTTFFVTFEGTDYTDEAFDKTVLGKIWNSASVQSFYTSIRDEVIEQFISDFEMTGQDEKMFDSVKDNLDLLTSRPMVLGGDVENMNVFFMIQTGAKKPQFVDLISKLEKLSDVEFQTIMIEGKEFKKVSVDSTDSVYWGWDDDIFVQFIDDDELLFAKQLLSTSSVLTTDYFSGFYGTDNAVPFVTGSVNVKQIFELIKNNLDEDVLSSFQIAIDDLGVENVDRYSLRVALKDTDILVESGIETTGGTRGLLGLTSPVEKERLGRLHGKTIDAITVNYDWKAACQIVSGLIKTLAPDVYSDIADGIAEAEGDMGIKIKGVIPDCFAGPLTFNMVAPASIPGSVGSSFTITADLKDAGNLEKTLNVVGEYFAASSGGDLQVGSEEYNGRKYHAWIAAPLALVNIMPTWTIADDKLVISSSKEMCFDSVDRLTADGMAGDSLGNVDDFKEVMSKIPNDVYMCRYIDTETKITSAMTSLQSTWPMVTGALADEGIKLPVMLPSISRMIKDAPPSFQYSYADSSGLHTYSQGLDIDLNSGVAAAAMGAAIAMPALGKAKIRAQRVISASNLKCIGTACNVYAFDYNDEFPPDLQALVDECDIHPKTFESPDKPAGFDGPSYIYIPGQNALGRADTILIYENPAYQTEGTNVLYVDGHVEYVEAEEFLRQIKETYKRLDRPMPDIEFGTY